MLRSFFIIGVVLGSICCLGIITPAQPSISEICPNEGIQQRPPDFAPGGIILTSFDGAATWVYDIDVQTRYPLPQTRPCTRNCRLSPDARWITHMNPETFVFTKMRLDGTERTPLVTNATDVEWWAPDILLIWTPDQRAFLRAESDPTSIGAPLDVSGVLAVQPGGTWGLALENGEAGFERYMVDLLSRAPDAVEQRFALGADRPYFNAAAWSPDGQVLAYVGDGSFDDAATIAGGEIFLISPTTLEPQQATNLFATYGAARINGNLSSDLSWSPDSSHIAFWVIPMSGANPEANLGNATLHIYNRQTGQTSRYCNFATQNHTPNPPRLIWSPDSSHIAFAVDVPDDGKGALLLAMNIATGDLTELSNGVHPALGRPDLVAWGNRP